MRLRVVITLLAVMVSGACAQDLAACEPIQVQSLTVTICKVQMEDAALVPTKIDRMSDFYRVTVVTRNTATYAVEVTLTATGRSGFAIPQTQSLDYNRDQNNVKLLFRVPSGSIISKPMITEKPRPVEVK